MSFPRYADVDLALLLELERLGRPVRPHETYDRVTAHFPKLTEADKTVLRKDGRTWVWTNMIHWARDHLRVQNVLAASGPGEWGLNSQGRALLEERLRTRGATGVSSFVESDRALPGLLGQEWARELRQRITPPQRRPRQEADREPVPPEAPAVSGVDLG